MALRLMIFDETCRGGRGLPGLSRAWWSGAHLYAVLGRLDAWHGAATWEDGLAWLAGYCTGEPIASIQFWGHGKWGSALVGADRLDAGSLDPGHRHRPALEAVRDRLAPGALWWFRTCETFGARAGHDLARRFSEFLGCRAAGHTHVIGHWQSGLHSLAPGERPYWSLDEGLAEGTPDEPVRARRSRPGAVNTITCWHGRLPPGW
jgi:hypothetical protein